MAGVAPPHPASAALTQSLVNRLGPRLAMAGSTLFTMTWQRKATPSDLLYFQLVASARRTSGSGCGSWRTPDAGSHGNAGTPTKCLMDGTARPDQQVRLADQCQLASWPTPVANDDNKTPEAHLAMKQRMGERDGTGTNRTEITSLQVMAKASTWATPRGEDAECAGAHRGTADGLHSQSQLTSWVTPAARDHKDTGHRDRAKGEQLDGQAQLAGWCSPAARDHKDTSIPPSRAPGERFEGSKYLGMQAIEASGTPATGSPAETEKPGQLGEELSHSSWPTPRANDDNRSVERSDGLRGEDGEEAQQQSPGGCPEGGGQGPTQSSPAQMVDGPARRLVRGRDLLNTQKPAS